MKKIVITGALGHIGSKLIRILPFIFKDCEVIMIDNLATQRYCSLVDLPKEGKYRFIEADILTSDLEKLFEDAFVVIHLAAITTAAGSFENLKEIETVNLDGTKKVALACEKVGSRLIFISTASVYGTQNETVDENCSSEELNPQSPYADSKFKSEEFLVNMKDRLKFVILRFGTIFGYSVGMRFHTAVNKFCWQATMGNPITVWETAYEQKRPYLGLNDAIDAMCFVIEKNIFNAEVYNVLTLNATVKDVIDYIKKEITNVEIDFVKQEIMNTDSYRVLNKKFKNLGFEFQDALSNSIGDTMNKLRSSNNTDELSDIKVEVLIPSYNRTNYLKRALSSLVVQKYKHFKVSIFDDVSNSETQEVLKKYSANDSRVSYTINKKNLGVFENHWHMFEQASLPYIVHLANDDMLLPNFFDKLIPSVKKYPNMGMYMGRCVRYNKDEDFFSITPEYNIKSGVYKGEAALELLLETSMIWTSGIINRKYFMEAENYLKKNGLQTVDNLAFDMFDINYIVSKYGIVVTDEPVAIYFHHNEQTSSNTNEDDFIKKFTYRLESFDLISDANSSFLKKVTEKKLSYLEGIILSCLKYEHKRAFDYFCDMYFTLNKVTSARLSRKVPIKFMSIFAPFLFRTFSFFAKRRITKGHASIQKKSETSNINMDYVKKHIFAAENFEFNNKGKV